MHTPDMPGVAGEAVDLTQVQQALQRYVTTLAGTLEKTPYMKSLLAFLDVIPSTASASSVSMRGSPSTSSTRIGVGVGGTV